MDSETKLGIGSVEPCMSSWSVWNIIPHFGWFVQSIRRAVRQAGKHR